MVDGRHLRHFLAIVETGSFHKAAQRVHLSQPALTKSIHRMEALLGEKLFDRGKTVEMTPFGRLMQRQAVRVLGGLDDMEREAQLFRGVERGELTIGVGPYMAHSIAGPAIVRLLAKRPKLRVAVHVDDFNHFSTMLRQRKIDLFVADLTHARTDREMEIIPVPREEVFWYVRPGHPLTEHKTVSMTQLFAFPFVGPSLPPWAVGWFDKNLPPEMKPLRVTLTCNNYATLNEIVRHSDCFTGLPRSAIVEDLRGGKFVRLNVKARKMFGNAGVVWLKGRTPSPAATALVAELREQIARLTEMAEELAA